MDIIEKALSNNLHLWAEKKYKEQTWSELKKISLGKNVFAFGVGGALDYFFRNCSSQIRITGVIDNDAQKYGQKLGWYCAEAWNTEYEDMLIQGPEILNNYLQSDLVVLVTNVNYYRQIVEQLEGMDITHIYIMLIMEYNSRKTSGWTEDFQKIVKNYSEECGKYPVVKNKIVMSYGEYGGHIKYITKHLLKRSDNLDIVWLVYHEKTDIPEGVRPVPKKNWKRYVYEMETAGIWIFDVTVEPFIIKRPEQIYIQTKHCSSITLKKFYLDDKSSCTSDEIAEWIKQNGRMMDYIFTGSKFDEDSCRSGFAFGGTTVRVGSARSDILFDKGVKEKVYDMFKIPLNNHIALYVPTYRDKEFRQNKGMSIPVDFEKLLNAFEHRFGGTWNILIRLHPRMSFEKSNIKESEKIINACLYPDSEELVAAADLMITDYSSIMFEGAFVKKPVFLYAYDRKEFIDGERELLLDYNSLPFPISENNEQLIENIIEFDEDKYKRKVDNFLAEYEVREDGHASERAAEFILNLIKS